MLYLTRRKWITLPGGELADYIFVCLYSTDPSYCTCILTLIWLNLGAHSCTFFYYFVCVQVVDMRWGVRDEATDDHMTTELCMKEIENCQRLSMGPNFVVRYSNWNYT